MKNKTVLALFIIFAQFLNFAFLDAGLPTLPVAEDAFAQDVTFPYVHTFSISAYYSPLPGQSHYVTGSYASDIRLNGRGTNGADGTPVYAGMVAAPKIYAFGTKMYIPGIGMTAVHDRGGAIVAATNDGSGPKYDRLDLWMGYGDKGLKRALNWGLKTVEVTVYGIDPTINENVVIGDYTPNEKDNQEYYYIPEYYEDAPEQVVPERLFAKDLWYLSEGDEVKNLQEYLEKLGYFTGIVNGYFGDETRMAIYLFQKDRGLVNSIADLGAGHFGPGTREALEKEILSRKEELSPRMNLGPSASDSDAVKKLQKALSLLGYDVVVSGEYDEATEKAVLKFQIDSDILANASEHGAGYFGPKTLSSLVLKIDQSISGGRISIPVAYANDEVGVMVQSRQILTPPLHDDLKIGDSGPEVKRLQQELKNLGLLRIDPTGNYGEVTEHAVFKFQQINGLVDQESSLYAGIFGSSTRSKMNEIIAEKNYYNRKISEKRVSTKVSLSN